MPAWGIGVTIRPRLRLCFVFRIRGFGNKSKALLNSDLDADHACH